MSTLGSTGSPLEARKLKKVFKMTKSNLNGSKILNNTG